MLKNVPVSELLKILLLLQKESPLCDIFVDSDGKGISFKPVHDPNAIRADVKMRVPEISKNKLNLEDLDKLII